MDVERMMVVDTLAFLRIFARPRVRGRDFHDDYFIFRSLTCYDNDASWQLEEGGRNGRDNEVNVAGIRHAHRLWLG